MRTMTSNIEAIYNFVDKMNSPLYTPRDDVEARYTFEKTLLYLYSLDYKFPLQATIVI